jgi:hypothetical protein
MVQHLFTGCLVSNSIKIRPMALDSGVRDMFNCITGIALRQHGREDKRFSSTDLSVEFLRT